MRKSDFVSGAPVGQRTADGGHPSFKAEWTAGGWVQMGEYSNFYREAAARIAWLLTAPFLDGASIAGAFVRGNVHPGQAEGVRASAPQSVLGIPVEADGVTEDWTPQNLKLTIKFSAAAAFGRPADELEFYRGLAEVPKHFQFSECSVALNERPVYADLMMNLYTKNSLDGKDYDSWTPGCKFDLEWIQRNDRIADLAIRPCVNFYAAFMTDADLARAKTLIARGKRKKTLNTNVLNPFLRMRPQKNDGTLKNVES